MLSKLISSDPRPACVGPFLVRRDRRVGPPSGRRRRERRGSDSLSGRRRRRFPLRHEIRLQLVINHCRRSDDETSSITCDRASLVCGGRRPAVPCDSRSGATRRKSTLCRGAGRKSFRHHLSQDEIPRGNADAGDYSSFGVPHEYDETGIRAGSELTVGSGGAASASVAQTERKYVRRRGVKN